MMQAAAGLSRRKRLACIALAVGLQCVLGVAANVNKWRNWFSSAPAIVEDTDIYYRYASKTLQGKIPYRDFLVEYPPLAFPIFLLPRLVTQSLAGYKVAFAAEMMLFQAATVGLLARWIELRHRDRELPVRLAWSTLYFLLLSRLILSRYDAAPMFLGFSATVCWALGRGRRAALLAASGALMKLFPAAVVLVGSIQKSPISRRFKSQTLLSFGLLCGAGAAAWLAIGGSKGVAIALRYQVERGFEYGSLLSTLQLLVAKATNTPFTIGRSHGSFSVVTPWSPWLMRLAMPLQIVMALAVCAAARRRGDRDLVRYAGAAVLGLILGGKVFSPQYLLWIVPFVTALEGPIGPAARWLFAVGCAMTLLSPADSGFLSRSDLWLIVAYAFKNLLFLGLWILLVFGTNRAAQPGNGSKARGLIARGSALLECLGALGNPGARPSAVDRLCRHDEEKCPNLARLNRSAIVPDEELRLDPGAH